MTRPLRIQYPGALYHVTTRGNRQEKIFEDDTDRYIWQRVLKEVCSRYRWNLHAYCMMGNHFHLMVETLDANLSAGMRQLNGRFTQLFNFRHGLAGHLFQGRFHSTLVQRDSYLLELCRYVVLNPVRACLTASPEQWHWSSYRATAGLAPAPEWLCTEWLLGQFAERREIAMQVYRQFVFAGIGVDSPFNSDGHQLLLGDDDYVKRQGADGALFGKTDIARRDKKAAVASLHEYRGFYVNRQEAMARAYLSGAFSMSEISRHFGVHYQTVSRAVKHFERV